MTSHVDRSTPGPVVTPASNPHRVGVPNHDHNSGREGTSMVDTDTHPLQTATIDLGGPLFEAAVAGAVAQRINRGDLDLADPWALPELVTGLVVELVTQVNADRIAVLRERLESVTAERDAANDAVNELVHQVDEARAGCEDAPARVYESTEAFLAHLDELAGDLEQGGGE